MIIKISIVLFGKSIRIVLLNQQMQESYKCMCIECTYVLHWKERHCKYLALLQST